MRFVTSTRGKIIIGAVAAGVLLLLIVLGIVISRHDAWPLTRDIALVALAVMGSIPLLAFVYVIILVARFAHTLTKEVRPIAQDLAATTHTITTTTRTTSDLLFKPTLTTASVLLGYVQVLTLVFGNGAAVIRAHIFAQRH